MTLLLGVLKCTFLLQLKARSLLMMLLFFGFMNNFLNEIISLTFLVRISRSTFLGFTLPYLARISSLFDFFPPLNDFLPYVPEPSTY